MKAEEVVICCDKQPIVGNGQTVCPACRTMRWSEDVEDWDELVALKKQLITDGVFDGYRLTPQEINIGDIVVNDISGMKGAGAGVVISMRNKGKVVPMIAYKITGMKNVSTSEMDSYLYPPWDILKGMRIAVYHIRKVGSIDISLLRGIQKMSNEDISKLGLEP